MVVTVPLFPLNMLEIDFYINVVTANFDWLIVLTHNKKSKRCGKRVCVNSVCTYYIIDPVNYNYY